MQLDSTPWSHPNVGTGLRFRTRVPKSWWDGGKETKGEGITDRVVRLLGGRKLEETGTTCKKKYSSSYIVRCIGGGGTVWLLPAPHASPPRRHPQPHPHPQQWHRGAFIDGVFTPTVRRGHPQYMPQIVGCSSRGLCGAEPSLLLGTVGTGTNWVANEGPCAPDTSRMLHNKPHYTGKTLPIRRRSSLRRRRKSSVVAMAVQCEGGTRHGGIAGLG